VEGAPFLKNIRPHSLLKTGGLKIPMAVLGVVLIAHPRVWGGGAQKRETRIKGGRGT
jgi:hypothetical protein